MLKKIYIDNYKSCVDFTVDFGPINLLMGVNGAGKTTIFDVLRLLQDFVRADSTLEELFLANTLTRWASSSVQAFGLVIERRGDLYEYRLEVEHNLNEHSVHIKSERLLLNNSVLLDYVDNVLHYLASNKAAPINVENIRFSRTTLDVIPENSHTAEITWFRRRMERFIIVQISPHLMKAESKFEMRSLDSDARNFSSWYRYISQDQGNIFAINQELIEILDDFSNFQLREAGDSRILWARFQQNGHSNAYRFDEFSEGQRVLVCLYAILHYAKSKDFTICLDEPDNYVALPEIQPWLIDLKDLCDDGELQALLISHHPELIDYLVPSRVSIWFTRDDGFSPTRTKSILKHDEQGVAVSELVARGWIDD